MVERTADVYERVIETGPQGLCEIGADGKVVYANPAMADLLEVAVPTGSSMAEYSPAQRKSGGSGIQSALHETTAVRGMSRLAR